MTGVPVNICQEQTGSFPGVQVQGGYEQLMEPVRQGLHPLFPAMAGTYQGKVFLDGPGISGNGVKALVRSPLKQIMKKGAGFQPRAKVWMDRAGEIMAESVTGSN